MKKSLAYVLFSNAILLVISLSTNLLIPKFVSIDTYTMIKTYTLYVSYAGFFHFGYNDGMYLKYGGKNLETIDKKDFANNVVNYVFLIFIMFSIVLVVSFILKDFLIFAFAFGMVSYNLLGYLKYLYQATGNFKLYGFSLNIEKILIFIFILCSIFILHSDNYMLYVSIQAIVGWLIAILLFLNLEKKLHFIKLGSIYFKEIITNIKSGFILMIGNFSNSIFTGLDRWFVKYLLTGYDFAMYSFAASLEAIVNVFISPITIIMYNYFCINRSVKEIKLIKKMALIYSLFVIAIAYPAKFILEFYLTKYISASSIIFFLFGAQLFYVLIKGIHINLYKAQKRQKTYLIQMITMIIIGFLLNIVFYMLFKNNESFALATFITSIIWLIICEVNDKKYRFSIKEVFVMLIACSIYFLTGFLLNAILGCVLYIISVIIIIYFLMNDEFIYGLSLLKKVIRKIKLKKRFLYNSSE